MTEPSTYRWFKSSYSGGSGTECVECAHVQGAIRVRDSKFHSGPVLAVDGHAWWAIVEALKHQVQEHG